MREFARRDHESAQHPAPPPNTLSRRQIEILRLVARGLTYSQIAKDLQLSEAAIRYHMTAVARQLQLKNRAQIIAYACRFLNPASHRSSSRGAK
jgi:DNA-binding NarL/FixJ family response regulator